MCECPRKQQNPFLLGMFRQGLLSTAQAPVQVKMQPTILLFLFYFVETLLSKETWKQTK